ncbi:unnamed protein product [Orchesella dallaii]|uniref:Uncharacterized protein n=1 Tax=Orchesella dallaii TaxID=48710 RepID=A0ABP1RNU1_9HEXA
MSSRRYVGSVSRNGSTSANDSVGPTRDTGHATGNKRLFETDDSLTIEEDIKLTPSGSSGLFNSYLDIQNRPIGSVKWEDGRNSMLSFGKPEEARTTLQFDTPAVGDRQNPQPQRTRGENEKAITRNPPVENEEVPDVKPIGWKKIKEEASKGLPLRAKAPQTVKRGVVSAGRITKPASRWRKGKRFAQGANVMRKLPSDAEKSPTPEPKRIERKRVAPTANNVEMGRKSADSEISKPPPKLAVEKSVARTAKNMKMERMSADSEELPKPSPKLVVGRSVGRGAKSMELEGQPPSDDEEASPAPEPKHVAVKGSARRANSMETPRKPPSDDEETPAPEPKQVDKKNAPRVAIVKPTFAPAASPTPTSPPRERTPPNSQSVGEADRLVRTQLNYPAGYPPLSTMLHHLPTRDRGVRVAEGVYLVSPQSSVIGMTVGFIIMDPHRSIEREEKSTYASVYTVLSGDPEFKLSGSESTETGRPGSMFTNLPGASVQLWTYNNKAIVSFSTIILDKI